MDEASFSSCILHWLQSAEFAVLGEANLRDCNEYLGFEGFAR
jgi:hypothetical protein